MENNKENVPMLNFQISREDMEEIVNARLKDMVNQAMKPHTEHLQSGLKKYFAGSMPWCTTDSRMQKSLAWAVDHLTDKVILDALKDNGFEEILKEEIKSKMSDKNFLSELAKNKIQNIMDNAIK